MISKDDIEYLILTELVQTEDITRTVIPYLKESYFKGNVNKVVFREIKEYFDKYNSLPTKDALTIDIANNATLFEKEYNDVGAVVDHIFDATNIKGKQNQQWVIDRAEEWCKQRAIYNAILESASIIDPTNKSKSKKPFTAIESMVRDALSVTFDNHVGHDYMDDADARYDFYHEKEERVPFGIDTFNTITGGGLPRKTLNVILAGVHVGKSAFMCDYAANCVRNGHKVLYITCEMAEERIAERIDANMMDLSIADIPTMGKGLFTKKIDAFKKKYTDGRLKIKEYPTGTPSVAHFRSLMNELAMKQNFIPDVIVIDYLNICSSMRFTGDSSNSYGYMKAIAEELRGMAIEFNVPILTATQVNRSGFGDSDFGMDSIAESFGIPATADFMFALIVTEALKKHGLICVKQLKNRYNDPSTNERFVVCYDRPKMTFSEADAAAQTLLSAGHLGASTVSTPMPGGGWTPPAKKSLPVSYTGGLESRLKV